MFYARQVPEDMSWSTALSIDAKRKNARGFTLIELMVTMAIIGIMAAIATQAFTKNVRRAHKAEVVSDLSTIVLRQNAALAVRGRYVSTANNENPATLYPPPSAFQNGGNPIDVVAWNVTSPTYRMNGVGNGGNFTGGQNYHGFDALNFLPEGGVSRCGYATISGVGLNGRNDAGVIAPVIPQTSGYAVELFPINARPGLILEDWFWAIARCDLDHDGEYWDFTVSSHDSDVVDADVDGIRAEF